MLDIDVESVIATDEDASGGETVGAEVEDPAKGTPLEVAGTAVEELARPGSEELVETTGDKLPGITGETLGGTTKDELGTVTGVEELRGLIATLLMVEVDRKGGTGVVKVVAEVAGNVTSGLEPVVMVVVEVVVVDVVVVDVVMEVVEVTVIAELSVDDDVALTAVV